MTASAPRVISLFAGGGGNALGCQQAGFEELAAVEYDRQAAHVFRHWFPQANLIERDIAQVSADELLEATGLGRGELYPDGLSAHRTDTRNPW